MILKIIGLLALAALIQGLIEPLIIRTTYVSLPLSAEKLQFLSRKRTLRTPNPGKHLPAAVKGKLRVLFFSDLHVNHFFLPEKYFIRRLLEHRPDLLVFGGDLVSKKHDRKKGMKLLKAISVKAAKVSVPVLFIRGNHDFDITDEELKQCGVILLKNSGLGLKFKRSCMSSENSGPETEYLIMGMDDRRTGQIDVSLARTTDAFPQTEALNLSFIHSRLRFETLSRLSEPEQINTLLFAHNPDTVLNLDAKDCDYFFSGHFHGGQIRMPFRLEFRTLRGEQLSQRKYYDGLFLMNEISAFISCGVGCVLFPLRFFSLPEITVFDI